MGGSLYAKGIFAAHRPDTSAPTFPVGAAVSASDVGTSVATLTWPSASDDVGVIGYELDQDGASLGSIAPSESGGDVTHQVTGLSPTTSYTFAVTALDVAGNRSEPLTAVVTTLGSTTTGDASLTATPRRDGGVDLSWDVSTDPDLAGYQLMRGTSADTLTPVGEVLPKTASTATDAGPLDAQTTYLYAVNVVHADSTTVPHTKTVSVTTAPIVVDVVRAPVSMIGSAVALGSTIPVSVTAQPGRAVTAVASYEEGATADSTAVTLTEGSPGAYAGSLAITAGMTELTAIEVTVSDGISAHDVTRHALPARTPVSGAVVLDITGAAAAGFTGYGTVSSATSHASATFDVSGVGNTTVPIPAADDVEVDLFRSDGTAETPFTGVSVAAGQDTTLSASPVAEASVTVHVRYDDGTPVASDWVSLSEGSFSRASETDAHGDVGPLEGFGAASTLTIASDLHSVYVVPSAPTTATLGPGDNDITLTLTTRHAAQLSGTVTVGGGGPVAGADVSVVQHMGDDTLTRLAATGSDGGYTVDGLYAGDDVTTTINASGANSVWKEDESLAAGPNTADIVLPSPKTYEITPVLYTQVPGGAKVEQPLDWRTAVHFDANLQVNGKPVEYGFSFQPGQPFDLTELPGTSVSLCADGTPAGLAAGCSAVTLGDDAEVTASLTLTGVQASVSVTPREPDRSQIDDFASVTLARDDDGAWTTVRTEHGVAGPSVTLSVSDVGTYKVTVTDDAARSASIEFSVNSSTTTLSFTPTLRDPSGSFAGAGNAVSTAQTAVVAGSTVDLRVAYRDNGPATVGSTTLAIGLPAGVTVASGGVTMNGQQVAGTVADDGSYQIDVGALAHNAGGVVTARLAVADDLGAAEDLTFDATMLADGSTDTVGTTSIPVDDLTLDAPTKATTLSLPASGRAPADAAVTIVDGGTVLGAATASEAGYWSATLTLPDLGEGHWFHIVAQTDVGDATLSSAPALVQYDRLFPAPLALAVAQTDGRAMSFSGGGVARYPYVWVPGMGFTVSATFADPSRVKNVVFHIGDNVAAATLSGGSYSGTVPLNKLPGAIFVDYDVVPTTASLADQLGISAPPGVDGVRGELPTALADFGGPVLGGATTNPDGSVTQSASVAIPSGGAGATMTTTFTIAKNVSYAPTSADLAAASASGAQVYGVSIGDPVEDDHSMTVSGTAYIPMSQLSPSEQGGLASSSGPRPRPAISEEQLVARVGYEVAFNNVTNLDSLLSSLTEGGKWGQMNGLLNAIGNCDDTYGSASGYNNQLSQIAHRALAYDGVNAALTVGGAALAPETFGLGTIALWGIGYGLGKVMDHQINSELEDLAKQISADPDCKQPPDDNPHHVHQELADPVWIEDPSGYVYEGVAGDRIDGVTATILRSDSPAGPFTVWDADTYGQANPLATDPQGRYAWDVPDGWYEVAFSKDGYQSATSDPVQVLPPHYDMNVGLVPVARPSVTGSTVAAGGTIDATFGTWMRASLLAGGQVSVTTADGDVIDGTVAPVDVQTTPDGVSVAKSVRFTPSEPLQAGTHIQLSIAAATLDFTGRSMASGYEADLTVPAAPPTGGGGGSGTGTASGSGTTVTVPAPTTPGGAVSVSATTATGTMTVTFDGVGESGQLGVTPASPDADGFVVLGQPYDLTATMPFTDAVVCLPYDPAALAAAGIGPGEVAVYHVGSDGVARDVTVSRDAATGTVCGTVSSFSPFFLGVSTLSRLAGSDRIATSVAVSAATFAPGVPVAYVAAAGDFADALAVGPLAAASGGPVLLTSGATLPAAVRGELERLKPANIVVVGGPAAVPDSVVAQLRGIAPTSRLAGADRYATAAAVSQAAFPTSVVTVYIARGDEFADALAAGPATARDHADLLILPASGVPDAISAELARLRPARVVIVGGTAAVSQASADALAALTGASVSRLGGADRYATAAAVAATFGPGGPVLLASGVAFPDALAAAPVAGAYGGPVLLTAPGTLPGATATALARLAASRLIVVGGTAAISQAVADAAAGDL